MYLRDGVTKWIHNWKKRGWKTADKKPVKNVELWQRLDAAAERHDINWKWVKGHADDEMNERADALARAGMKPFLRSEAASCRGATRKIASRSLRVSISDPMKRRAMIARRCVAVAAGLLPDDGLRS